MIFVIYKGFRVSLYVTFFPLCFWKGFVFLFFSRRKGSVAYNERPLLIHLLLLTDEQLVISPQKSCRAVAQTGQGHGYLLHLYLSSVMYVRADKRLITANLYLMV